MCYRLYQKKGNEDATCILTFNKWDIGSVLARVKKVVETASAISSGDIPALADSTGTRCCFSVYAGPAGEGSSMPATLEADVCGNSVKWSTELMPQNPDYAAVVRFIRTGACDDWHQRYKDLLLEVAQLTNTTPIQEAKIATACGQWVCDGQTLHTKDVPRMLVDNCFEHIEALDTLENMREHIRECFAHAEELSELAKRYFEEET